MNIGEAARISGLSTKTIRYYESRALINRPGRTENNYRNYDQSTLTKLRFLSRARKVGFSLHECEQLLGYYEDQNRRSAHVKSVVIEKITQIDKKITELKAMRKTLIQLASQCAGDETPTCAIIDSLTDEE